MNFNVLIMVSYMYEEKEIYLELKRYSQIYSENLAIIGANDDIAVSYSDLWENINSIAGNLKAQGVRPRDTVLAMLDNSPRALQLMLACLTAGFNYAPIACDSTQSEVKKIILLTGSKFALIENTVNESLISSIIKEVKLIDLEFATKKTDHNFRQIKSGEMLIGTSGSVGEPKIMRISADRLWSSGFNFLKIHPIIDENSRFYNILPMSYLGGLFNLGIAPLSVGASIVVDNSFSGASFLDFWQRIERFKINALWLVPTIMRGLLEISKRINREKYIKYPPVDVCFLGTAPINLETKISFEELTNIPVLENYGLSETTFISTETIGSRNQRKQGSVGEILPWVNLKASQDKMTSNSDSIIVSTPSIMLGYLGDKSADKWFDTKDCGYIDKDKVLILRGRNRDIIKKGGVMLALREIEILAEQSCGAREACAVAVEHQFYGESYILYVVSEMRIDNCLHKHLAKNKWPDEIIPITKLPRTRSGKLDKKKLKKH